MVSRIVALGLALTLAASAAFGAAEDAPNVKRGYVDGRWGQVHYAMVTPTTPSKKPPLVMFHQTPYSLVEFGPLIAEMGKDRVAIAFDTPGYGGSDAPPSLPLIEDYAAVMAEVLKTMGYGPNKQIDVMGNHTGAFIATALANQEPKLVRRLALIGVYVVPPESLAKTRANLVQPTSYADVFDALCTRLPALKAAYAKANTPDAAWGAIRADSLQPPGPKREYGHVSAFEYASRVTTELPRVQQPVALLVIADNIDQATRASKPLFKRVELVEMMDVATGPGVYDGAFFTGTTRIAEETRKFLDKERVAAE